jgi:alginate O-acetyltransferase complex protein AlgI
MQHGIDRICIGLFLVAVSGVLENGWVQVQGLNDAYRAFARNFSAVDVWCLTIGFGFQLFFNFAGYSHVVIGAARLFGFVLPENFDRPYFATTPSEFWSRWHMSLSFWIRDYLFIPLATLGRTKLWRNVALLFSMLIFGLWHEGTILLAIWGTYQGILLVMHRLLQSLIRGLNWNIENPLFSLSCWFLTFSSINLGWILFRSEDLTQAVEMLRSLTEFRKYSTLTLPHTLFLSVLILTFGYFVVVGARTALRERFQNATLPLEGRIILYSIAVYLAVLHSAETQAFAYFKF